MNKEQVINKLIFYIEDCFDMEAVTISNHSILTDFCPDELDIELFLTEVDLDFHVDLKEVFRDKLLHTPIFELADYLLDFPRN